MTDVVLGTREGKFLLQLISLFLYALFESPLVLFRGTGMDQNYRSFTSPAVLPDCWQLCNNPPPDRETDEMLKPVLSVPEQLAMRP